LVVTNTEEGHDKLVEKVLRRLEENDLFVKPEKYRWKVSKVEFLGVIIGLKGVEIQKVKVKGVLNWLIPKNVKEMQKFLELANYYRRFIKKLCQDNCTTLCVSQEGAEMEVEKEARRGVWETQESVHNRIYPSDPGH